MARVLESVAQIRAEGKVPAALVCCLVFAPAILGACAKQNRQGSGEIALHGAASRVIADARASIEEARSVLARAEEQQALWIPARDALRAAQAAMENGQHDAALRHAKLALQLGQLGLEQTRYPLIEPYR